MAARIIGKVDLRFDDPRLRLLQQHVNRITEEMQKLQAMLDEGAAGQVLVKRSSADFDAAWLGEGAPGGGDSDGDGSSGGGGGGSSTIVFGETNTGRNVGGGVGIFKTKSGVILDFRSLVGAGGIQVGLDEANDQVIISAAENAAAEAALQFEPLVIAGAFA